MTAEGEKRNIQGIEAIKKAGNWWEGIDASNVLLGDTVL